MSNKLIAKLAVATLLPIGAFAVTTEVATVQASAKSTLKTFPKSLRRTWYHYDGHGRYDTVKLTSKHYYTKSYYEKWYHSSSTLHSRNGKTDPEHLKMHSSWVVGHAYHIGKAHWTNIMGWNQSAGDGTSYKLEIRKYHHKNFRLLSEGGGAELWISQHYYATKKVAHVMGNRHFSGEHYY